MSTDAIFARFRAAALLSLFLCGTQAALAQGGPPAFPQKFEVRGPENASFAFPVTQPGPVVVDVRWEGPDLDAVLAGPNMVRQRGNGNLVINYNVTPQDLQKGTLWTINLRIAAPAPGAAVSGQINVQSPPVDGAAATRAMQGRALTKQQQDQLSAALNAGVEQYVAQRRSEIQREFAQRQQAENQKLQAILAQRGGATTGLAQPPAMQLGSQAPQPMPGQVTSRAIPPQGGGTKIEAMKVAPGDRRPVLIPILPFEITSITQTSGGPFTGFEVKGTSFGTTQGRVSLTVPANTMISACTGCPPIPTNSLQDTAINLNVVQWTDTSITVQVPDLTMVQQQYLANIFVVRPDNAYSNRVVFQFVPRMDTRVMGFVPGDRRYTSTVVTRPLPSSGASMMHVRFPAFPFSEFVGERGNDEYFLYSDLTNNWTVRTARVIPLSEMRGIPPEVATILRDGGGAYIEGTPSGTDLYLNVRWWINALFPYAYYAWTLEITGPAGTADGVLVK